MDPDHRNANLACWEERVPIHMRSALYDVDGFRAGRSTLRSFEVDEVGPVEDRSLLHLQCHFGLDSLSWARLGARVTGLDFSPAAIAAAQGLSAETDIPASFVQGDVLQADEILRRTFDVVYTGLGAICWIDDLPAWSRVVSRLVRPGGLLYLAEFHPVTDMFAEDSTTVVAPYFDGGRAFRDETPGSYADPKAPTKHDLNFTWTHPIGSVVTCLIEAGFRLEHLHEHDFTLFPRFPFLEKEPDSDIHRVPPDRPRLPLMYSLRARRI